MALAALAVLLVGGAYYVLTQVVTIARIQQEVQRLPTVSLVELLPPPTPTNTPAPTRATEVRPTPTRIPTATAVASSTPTPLFTATATPTVTLTPRPPTATSSLPYAAIELVAPATGTEFAGADSTITLSWKAPGVLKDGEGYRVTLRYQASGQPQTTEAWVQETLWRVPAEVHDRRDAAAPEIRWSVQVTRGTADGQALSPPSAVWTFVWR